MKTLINICNPTTGNEIINLDELKSRINDRRKEALKRDGNKKVAVISTNKNLQQVAAHYRSFEISNFSYEKAISVFNACGCQKASIIQ